MVVPEIFNILYFLKRADISVTHPKNNKNPEGFIRKPHGRILATTMREELNLKRSIFDQSVGMLRIYGRKRSEFAS